MVGSSGRLNNEIRISVVIPIHDEESLIIGVLGELFDCLKKTQLNFEVIVVDDGSTDDSLKQIKSLLPHTNLRILACPVRLGQSAALWAGMQAAAGSIIVTMDGDGQNDPSDIVRAVAFLQEVDLVVGHRVIRKDSIGKRVFSRIANHIRNALTGSRLSDSGCGLKAFRREWLKTIIPFRGMHRFFPVMIEISGGRVGSIEVNHRPRAGGFSKYGVFDRMLIPLMDCLALAWLKKRRFPPDAYKRTASFKVVGNVTNSKDVPWCGGDL